MDRRAMAPTKSRRCTATARGGIKQRPDKTGASETAIDTFGKIRIIRSRASMLAALPVDQFTGDCGDQGQSMLASATQNSTGGRTPQRDHRGNHSSPGPC